MTDETRGTEASGPTHWGVEVGLAFVMVAFALIVIGGSMRAGIGWAADGPRAGFFPFYCGMFVLAASLFNLFSLFAEGSRETLFAEWSQLRRVVSVVVPSAVYVAIVPWTGMYVASVLLIVMFMKWIGHYGWGKSLAISVPVMIATFFVFERWFLVPLPKGPLEAYLGY